MDRKRDWSALRIAGEQGIRVDVSLERLGIWVMPATMYFLAVCGNRCEVVRARNPAARWDKKHVAETAPETGLGRGRLRLSREWRHIRGRGLRARRRGRDRLHGLNPVELRHRRGGTDRRRRRNGADRLRGRGGADRGCGRGHNGADRPANMNAPNRRSTRGGANKRRNPMGVDPRWARGGMVRLRGGSGADRGSGRGLRGADRRRVLTRGGRRCSRDGAN